MPPNNAPPVCIDLFAGAGGLAEGLLQAGLAVAASVELHPQAALTHAFNHPDTRVLVGDIRELSLEVLDGAVRSAVGDRRVDIVAGGPPCQGFSSAGKKAETDPRNSLFRHFVRVIEHTRPRMFLMENVPGFRSRYDGRVYTEAFEAFSALGYEVTDRVIAAAPFGVPQTRRRFVMVGWLPDEIERPFRWPEPTHGLDDAPTLFGGRESHAHFVTAGDALEGLAFLEPGFEATRHQRSSTSAFDEERRAPSGLLFNHLATQHRARAVKTFELIPPGGSIRDIPEEQRSTKKLTMARLHPDQLSNTVVSLADDIIHYRHHRNLTVRENARLQTFDDDYVFLGKRTSGYLERRVDVPQYTQVGNAVPPLLARALGECVARSLGAAAQDLRPLEQRRERHELVLGSSAYAGYSLATSARELIKLQTVNGDDLPLPPPDPEAQPVASQPSIMNWKTRRRPAGSQWAPGIKQKAEPAWMGAQP